MQQWDWLFLGFQFCKDVLQMHDLGCTLYIVVRFLWFSHYYSLLSETLFDCNWLLTKILSVKVSMMLIVINDSYVFDWSLVRLWIPFFKWTETAKMESPFEYKPKTSFLPKRTHSREEVIVKFLVWFGWLGCGRYSLLVFRFLECYFNELRVFF